MVAVSLIVLLLILLLTVAMAAGGSETVTVDLFGADLTTSGSGVYVIGLVAGATTVVTLWLLRVGLRKGWRQHQRIKDLERRADQSDQSEKTEPTPTQQQPAEPGPDVSDADRTQTGRPGNEPS
ncbi:hypothetical protein [Haloactinopolyspora sp.]|uniref:hypothetical protein n=1 Tax=Haloactinopolyspora sp. TaxID=1966353 RepID=UPI0026053FEE|nr:hypothetical protein [Haloactinopolyspora sp.]